MKISPTFKDFKGRKGSQVERRGGRRWEKGAKGMALQTSFASCKYPDITGLYPETPVKGGLVLGPIRNQTRSEQNQNSNQKPDQNQNLSSQPRGVDQALLLSSGRGPLTRFLHPGPGN